MNEPGEIIAAVAAECGVTPDAITGRSRVAHIVEARSVAAWLLRRRLHWKWHAIGHALGGRHHSAALRGAAAIEYQFRQEEDVAPRLRKLMAATAERKDKEAT